MKKPSFIIRIVTVAVSVGLAVALGCTADDLLGGADAGESTSDDFTEIYNSTSFQGCADCHAPGAAGFVDGTEATQDWSSRNNAYQSLQGTASGLIGNFADCNGVPFIGDGPESSLLVATLDETVRQNFDLVGFPECNVDTISDMTLKVGAIDGTVLAQLKQWISAGAPSE